MNATTKAETTKTSKSIGTGLRKKISVRQVKLSAENVGFSFTGKFVGWAEGKPFNVLDEKTGEIVTKQLKSAIFESADGERTAYLADAGLQGAFADSLVKENDWLEVVKLEKQKLSKGRTMNAYDIYAIKAPGIETN